MLFIPNKKPSLPDVVSDESLLEIATSTEFLERLVSADTSNLPPIELPEDKFPDFIDDRKHMTEMSRFMLPYVADFLKLEEIRRMNAFPDGYCLDINSFSRWVIEFNLSLASLLGAYFGMLPGSDQQVREKFIAKEFWWPEFVSEGASGHYLKDYLAAILKPDSAKNIQFNVVHEMSHHVDDSFWNCEYGDHIIFCEGRANGMASHLASADDRVGIMAIEDIPKKNFDDPKRNEHSRYRIGYSLFLVAEQVYGQNIYADTLRNPKLLVDVLTD